MAWNYLQKKNHLCIVEDFGFQFELKEHVHLILMYNCGHCIDKTQILPLKKFVGSSFSNAWCYVLFK